MISMTGTVRPTDSPRMSALLGQNLRRNFEHTLLFTGQMFVILPDIGAILVTEQPGAYRLDVVGNDQDTVDQRVARLEGTIRKQAADLGLRFAWQKMAHIPVPFR
ncbi:hypothetical protein JF66_18415 [Cryobacterium sp. MLB-32]|uniref:hypothetical protein n=1 Tax=Cryobacterium sp. MLB-32 TaxID=1529318 RepID=UPI0004E6B9DD|nr:hypothetical protein [Cryobacterium sp. MLB-32]KFF58458.1 hypothetical protein JF66_18415 [Cryobacterium sp. MLB-32]